MEGGLEWGIGVRRGGSGKSQSRAGEGLAGKQAHRQGEQAARRRPASPDTKSSSSSPFSATTSAVRASPVLCSPMTTHFPAASAAAAMRTTAGTLADMHMCRKKRWCPAQKARQVMLRSPPRPLPRERALGAGGPGGVPSSVCACGRGKRGA